MSGDCTYNTRKMVLHRAGSRMSVKGVSIFVNEGVYLFILYLNLNSLLVTRQMTLFHQGVRMGGGISPLNARVKRTWTHNPLTFQQ